MRAACVKKTAWVSCVFLSLVFSVSANEDEAHFLDASLEEILAIPLDTNAVNILESHVHKKNKWMIGYRYMHMGMNGNLSGENQIDTSQILQDYMVAPKFTTRADVVGDVKFIKFIEWKNPAMIDKTEFIMCLQKHDAAFDAYTKRQVQGKIIKLQLVEDQGGIIELGNKNNRLNFSINWLMAKASQLNVGFQLLSLARKVIEK